MDEIYGKEVTTIEPVINHEGKVCQVHDDHSDTWTHLQGVIEVSYQKLVEMFGLPNAEHDDYKSDACWLVCTPDGVATIYNWKDGENYLGEQGLPVEEISEWHVGTHTPQPMRWIQEALNLSDRQVHTWQ